MSNNNESIFFCTFAKHFFILSLMNKINKFLKVRVNAARKVSKITGKSTFFHFLDCTICNLIYGCRSYQYSDMGFYKIPYIERSRIMTSRHVAKAYRLNDTEKLRYFNSKSEFDKHFDKFIQRAWINCRTSSPEQIETFLRNYPEVIVKPNGGQAGNSVTKINTTEINIQEYAQTVSGKNRVMEECVKQHPALSYGSRSVNTIRMATMVDRNGEAHILTASFRCGIGDSIVDNWSAGGVAYPINLDYGRIESYGFQADNMNTPVYVHPGTNTFMLGEIIPYWEEAKAMVLEACKVFPTVRYIGWDIAITPNGPLLIEGNPSPGFATLEGIGNTRGIYGMIQDLK